MIRHAHEDENFKAELVNGCLQTAEETTVVAVVTKDLLTRIAARPIFSDR